MTTTSSTMRIAGETEKALPRRLKFTAKALAAILRPSNPTDRVWVYDTVKSGLAYLVTGKGARSFYLAKRIHGKPSRVWLRDVVTIDQARNEVDRLNGSIVDGADPLEQRRQQRRAGTLAEAWGTYKQYLESRATPKTIATDASRYETCLAEWGQRKVLDISPADVRSLHAELGITRGKVSANGAVQLLRRIYNAGKLGYNPVARGEVAMFRETSRTRFLSADEMRRFLLALSDIEINPDIADIIRLSLFTGARRSNCLAARADEFDLDSEVWTVPAAKSKNADAMSLPLVPQAAEIIQRRMGHPSGFLFPSHSAVGHIVEVKSTWKKVLKLAKLTGVHFHDCRRTYASWMAAGGTSLQIVGKALGHKNPAATAIYSRLDLTAVRNSATAAVAAMVQTDKGKSK